MDLSFILTISLSNCLSFPSPTFQQVYHFPFIAHHLKPSHLTGYLTPTLYLFFLSLSFLPPSFFLPPSLPRSLPLSSSLPPFLSPSLLTSIFSSNSCSSSPTESPVDERRQLLAHITARLMYSTLWSSVNSGLYVCVCV